MHACMPRFIVLTPSCSEELQRVRGYGGVCRLKVHSPEPNSLKPELIVAIVIAGVVMLLVGVVLLVVICRQCRARMQDPQVRNLLLCLWSARIDTSANLAAFLYRGALLCFRRWSLFHLSQ